MAPPRPKSRPPVPGAKVRGSESGRPIMAALDLLGRRWVLRIIWELRGGPLTFRALQDAAGEVSPSVLNARLKELRAAALIETGDAGYALTAAGRDLLTALGPLLSWSENWAKAVAKEGRPRAQRG
ncbi:MAG: transcriptional regulator [Alphaproteobacteria bacterium]|nr:transcriptional regulator [Alphaproteobacteria bacterium]